MQHVSQQEPLRVQHFEANQWALPLHTQTFFELILVEQGSGVHLINGNRFPYRAGDVFFLRPSDNHGIVIDQPTRFYDLSFTELYVHELMAAGAASWTHLAAHRLYVLHPLTGSLGADRTEQRNLLALADMVWAEQNTPCSLLSNPVVQSLMTTILRLLDRHLAQHAPGLACRQTTSSALIQQMLTYVRRHITEPESLRMDKLADVFNYSPSHLGALFRQHAGESIQQYIIRYKLKLVETRLSLSSMSISQIADEFGFSDVCHLNKLFKRYYQHTPTNYRRHVVN